MDSRAKATNNANLFNVASQKQELLTTSQGLFGKQLNEEEVKFWIDFMKPIPMADLKYAFENWNRNGRFFPKPKDISDLCEAYRMSLANQQHPIGCSRCEWTGFYEVSRKGVERVVSPCPCRTNPSLREKQFEHYGQGYNENDMKWLFRRMQQEIKGGRKIDSDALLAELDRKRPDGAPEFRR